MKVTQILTAAAISLTAFGACAQTVVGVSWSNFQEERWKTDEAAIKAVVEAAGDKYISTDAQLSAQKQASDIEGLIALERANRGDRPERSERRPPGPAPKQPPRDETTRAIDLRNDGSLSDVDWDLE